MEERKEHHPEHHIEHHSTSQSHPVTHEHVSRKSKSNLWMIISVVLIIIVLILVYMVFFSKGITSKTISADQAQVKLIDFLNARTGGGVTFVSTADKGALYEVTVTYQDQKIPVYITKDGNYFVQGAVELTTDVLNPTNATQPKTPPTADVPKTDKPVVEAFIFSYCPYGLQFEKALFPVYDLLKSKADIKIVAIGAMHGEFERVESLRQICIEKLYNRDKLFAYLAKFNANTEISGCSGDATCLDPLLKTIYTSLSIDKTKVESCMAKDAPALYDAEVASAQALGISGSPTFVINGVTVQVGRTPEAIKAAVCNAFTTTPTECAKTLSTASVSAGFGSGAGSAASSTASC